MKKFLMLIAVIMLMAGIGGQAGANFQDGRLIRAVYQMGGQNEVLTDLGAFSPTTPYAGGTISFTANPFPAAGSGAFSGATWDQLQVAYFVKESTAGGFPANYAWTSGPAVGQTSGYRKFTVFESAANSVYAGANATASGAAQATLLQSDLQSYVYKMDGNNPALNAGYFSQFIPLSNGEQNLAALGTGSTYVDSYLYYYASPNATAAGLQVANIRTYADGHSAIVVNVPAATHFTLSAPASATTGTAVSFTVTAKDAGENTVAGYTGIVHFTSTDGAAVLPANATLTNGTGTFQVTLNTAGNQTITATDTVTATITGTSGTIAAGTPVATHFTVSAPGSATAGTPVNFTVTAKDAGENTVTGYTGTVHFTSTDGSAVLPADTALTNGTGTFQSTLKTAGNQTITVTDTVTATITGTSSVIPTGAASATHFTVSAPASAITGAAVSFTVTALDQFNNKVTSYAGIVHLTSTDGAAVLPANATLTNGTGTFQVTLNTAGNQTITATDTVTATITGTSGAIAAGTPVATHFTVSAPTSATAGTAFSFTVTAKDAGENTVTGYTGTVHFTSTDGSAVLPANFALPNGTGTFQATLKTAGSRTITATDTVTTPITGTSGAIAVGTSAATHFTVSAPASATTGTAVSLTVTALDQFNNKVTSYAGIVHFTSTDGAAVLPANATLTNGTGTFQATLNTAGNQTITATDTVTATITGTSGAIAAGTPVATHFTVSAPTSATAGTAFSFIVTVLDVGNRVVTGYSGVVHFTSTDSAAVLPADAMLTNGTGTFQATLKTAGSQIITATDDVIASITGISGTITAGTSVATHFTVSAPASATVGKAFSFTVTALDQFNNKATAYAGTVHFTSGGGAATLPMDAKLTNGTGIFQATLKTAGSRTITATDTLNASIAGTSNVIIMGAVAATHFTVSAPASAIAGNAFNFTVTALDAGNNVVAGYTGTVHFASVGGAATLPANTTFTNGTSTFQATLKTAGSRTITATDTVTASIAGTSNVIMTGAAPATHFTVSAPASVTAGRAFNFTVTALDRFNNRATDYAGTTQFNSTDGAASLPANSTLTNGIGTFPATLKTAGSRTITVIDTLTWSIAGASSAIKIGVGAATHFTVSAPAAATAGKVFSFTVTALDRFNNKATAYAGAVQFTSSGGAATLPAKSKLTNGMGTFPAIFKKTGIQTVTVTDATVASTTGTSNAITVQ